MDNSSVEKDLAPKIIQVIRERTPNTVEQLVGLVRERLQIPEREILQLMLRLQSEGKISLVEQQPKAYLAATSYLKTGQALWYWLTTALAFVTAAVVFTVPENLYPWVYIRYGLGSVFVLWLPGFSFVKGLFPDEPASGKVHKNLHTMERIALSLGMSLALVPIVGLLLNYTPWGIRLMPITLSLLAVTVAFATAAVIREYQATIKKVTWP